MTSAAAQKEDQVEKKRGPGRPRGEPTVVTTVWLPAGEQMSSPSMIAKITAWLDYQDLDALIAAAAEHNQTHFQKTGEYKPYRFRVDDGGRLAFLSRMAKKKKLSEGESPNAAERSREFHKEELKAWKKNLRIPTSLSNRVRLAARKLDCTPSDIIRLAMVDAYPNMGQEIRYGGHQPKFDYDME